KITRVWTCDSARVRRQLADEFMLAFHQTESRLGNRSAKMAASLRHLTKLLTPDSRSRPEPGRNLVSPPSIGALGGTVALDLDTSWWSRFWKSKPTADEQAEAVENLVRQVFYPIVDELMSSFQEALEGYIRVTLQWSSA